MNPIKYPTLIVKGVKKLDRAFEVLKSKVVEQGVDLLTKLAADSLNHEKQKPYLDDLRKQGKYLLIVLDALRYDYFASMAPLYLQGDLQPITAEGHDTFEYVSRCWDGDHTDVKYVSGATPINSIDLDYDAGLESLYDGDYRPGDHLDIVDVWDYGWDETLGTCPPGPVISETVGRLQGEDTLVCHLFQPHAPYIGEYALLGHHNNESAVVGKGDPVDEPIWLGVTEGRIPDSSLRRAYVENLRYVLESVCWLVQQVEDDRRIVVMGDHGEALGEFGIYAHPKIDHPRILETAWMEVSGITEIGEQMAQPPEESSQGEGDGHVKERLEALGYLE